MSPPLLAPLGARLEQLRPLRICQVGKDTLLNKCCSRNRSASILRVASRFTANAGSSSRASRGIDRVRASRDAVC